MSEDTIFALSSGAGKAGVAVFRLSGPLAITALEKLTATKVIPKVVKYSTLKNPDTEEVIDSGIYFSFLKPASFTGENMAEIQVHGSYAVIDSLSEVLRNIGLRPAEPGEFTLRAFRNGKMDLSQAEALADLIDAETSLQRQQALVQNGGALSDKAMLWRELLIGILAPLEASIDFPDEEDIPAEIEKRARPVIEGLLSELTSFVSDASKAQRVRRGVTVILLGAPNAGKSSLLNYLAQSDVAITSNVAGTTRDLIEIRIELAQMPVTLIDTAGLRVVTLDPIEQEGIKRAKIKAAQSDIQILVVDAAQADQQLLDMSEIISDCDFIIFNKNDLVSHTQQQPNNSTARIFDVSIYQDRGLDKFLEALEVKVRELCGRVDEPRLFRERHISSVNAAITDLSRALGMLSIQPELSAEDVRLAIRSLGSITGQVDVEEVLGEIFSSFCIGK